MKKTSLIMDMPITIDVIDDFVENRDLDDVFDYFIYIDKTFSTYKKTSEISKINNKKLKKENASLDIKEVLTLCEKTKKETNGYFNVVRNKKIDPSGIVKGWAILKASEILKQKGFKNFYIDAGGDIQVAGNNKESKPWKVGIRNPFNRNENIKILEITDMGIATSGTYIRGQHIYNPFSLKETLEDILSITVIGPNIYEADRFATASFAMQEKGIEFIESLSGFEAYMINKNGIAIQTRNFDKFVYKN